MLVLLISHVPVSSSHTTLSFGGDPCALVNPCQSSNFIFSHSVFKEISMIRFHLKSTLDQAIGFSFTLKFVFNPNCNSLLSDYISDIILYIFFRKMSGSPILYARSINLSSRSTTFDDIS